MARTNVSVVKYLNSAPLAWGILHGPEREQFDVRLHSPAECADELRRGAVDAGLIPSIEYQRIPGCRIVNGPAVISAHRVRSVLVVSRIPLWQVRTVATDNTSRTSVALTQVLFHDFFGSQPQFEPAEPQLDAMLLNHDAALLIGDEALRFMERGPAHRNLQVFDLVERWRILTGLPFTFAFWAVRDRFSSADADALRRSWDLGVQQIPAIAAENADRLNLPEPTLRRYLTENVSYHMTSDALDGLMYFYQRARAVGAISNVRRLEFL